MHSKSSAPNRDTDKTIGEILACEQALTKAEREGDAKALVALLSPDFRGVTFSGRRVDRDQFIASFGTPGFMFITLEISQVDVRLTADQAVAIGRSEFEAQVGGMKLKAAAHFLDVWVRTGSQWRLAESSATPIKP